MVYEDEYNFPPAELVLKSTKDFHLEFSHIDVQRKII